MNKSWSLLFSLGCYAVGNSLICNSVIAQVTPDGTSNTTVNPDESNNFTIENGDRAGGNLFHSFDQFSVPTNGSAVFNNAPEIDNIFSRVTGGNISNIDGLIQANDANLFLVNPAGIMFGNNARLDIGGSFLGTTADSILFEDGEFSATDFDNPPLLTVNAPIGLGFRDNPQPITNQSIADDMGLQVDTGKNVTLVGGDIFFDGGVTFAPGGRVELGGLAEEGTVSFNDDLSLNFSEDLTRANVSLTNEAVINVRADRDGSIAINSRNLEILEGSKVRAGIASGLGSPQSLAGNIDVNSTETVTISGANTFISNAVVEGATGNAGDANITTESLVLSDGGQANSLTQGQGNAGNVNIAASDISLDGIASDGDRSGFFSTVASGAVGDGGEINIKTASLSANNGAVVNTSTFGQGDAGLVSIKADTLSFDGVGSNGLASGIFSTIEEDGVGDARGINITTEELSLSNGAVINASTFGQGNAGLVDIQANSISIALFSSIFSTVESGAVGDGGVIDIQAQNLSLTNGGQIQTVVRRGFPQLEIAPGNGIAGDIKIDVDEAVIISGIIDINGLDNSFPSLISSSLDLGATGESGEISITSGSLSLIDGGQISSSTFGQGNAGNVIIDIKENIELDGVGRVFTQGIPQGAFSGIFSTVESGAVGDGGVIDIQAQNLSLTNGGQIQTVVRRGFPQLEIAPGNGIAGDIKIDVDEAVTISGISEIVNIQGFETNSQSSISSSLDLGATGKSGEISITADSLSINDVGFISSSTLGKGDANDINIKTSFLNLRGGGQIGTAVFRAGFMTPGGRGEGGNITINATDSVDISGVSTIQLVEPDISGDPSNTVGLRPTEGFSSGLVANTESGASGDAGDITVNTSSFRIADGAIVNNTTSNEGQGGDIFINTAKLNLTSGGQILTTAIDSSGDAGTIKLNVSDAVNIFGRDPNFEARLARANEFGSIQGGRRIVQNQGAESGIFANTSANSTGDGGSIEIGVFREENNNLILNENDFTNVITLSDMGKISADSQGSGNGGNVIVRVRDLTLNNQAQILAETSFAQPEEITSSEINLSVDNNLILQNNSTISAQAFNDAVGGNIDIDSNFVIAFPNQIDGNGSDIVASAAEGQGGNINIIAEALFGIQKRQQSPFTNDIDASSEFSLDGTVSINTPDINPLQGAIELPTNVVEPDQTVAQACAASRDTKVANSFVVRGKGGVPSLPTASLNSELITINGKSTIDSANSGYAISTSKGDITPARGIIKTEDGQVILTAMPVAGNTSRTPNGSINCGDV